MKEQLSKYFSPYKIYNTANEAYRKLAYLSAALSQASKVSTGGKSSSPSPSPLVGDFWLESLVLRTTTEVPKIKE